MATNKQTNKIPDLWKQKNSGSLSPKLYLISGKEFKYLWNSCSFLLLLLVLLLSMRSMRAHKSWIGSHNNNNNVVFFTNPSKAPKAPKTLNPTPGPVEKRPVLQKSSPVQSSSAQSSPVWFFCFLHPHPHPHPFGEQKVVSTLAHVGPLNKLNQY